MRNNHILLFTASRIIYSKKTKKLNKANDVVQVGRYYVFCQDAKRHLHQLPRNTLDEDILLAYVATLNLYNEKNGWKGVCVYQEHNGDEKFSPVRALGRWLKKRHTCQHIGWKEKERISMLIT